MKTIILLLLTFIVLNEVKSQENFEYTPGSNLRDYWYYIGPLGNENYVKITFGGLEFPYYAGSGISNAAFLDTIGPELLWQFIEFTGFSIGSVYTSFLVNVKNAKPAGQSFADIGNSVIIPSRYFTTGGVYVQDRMGKIAFGVSKSFYDTPVYTSESFFIDSTYLIVLKYTFVSGSNNDLMSLFVFSQPPPADEPAPMAVANPHFTDIPDVGCFEILMGLSNSPQLTIDGIYMRDEWDNNILPVDLKSFVYQIDVNNVALSWETSAEQNNYGFEVHRKAVNEEWLKIGFVKSKGNSDFPFSYIFQDKNLKCGSYLYRLKQTDFNGNSRFYDLKSEVIIGLPEKFSLSQNYPNPFNPETKIEYSIPFGSKVNISVYDIFGREIKKLVNEYKDAGYYSVKFNGSNFASGVYFYQLEAGSFNATKRMMIIK